MKNIIAKTPAQSRFIDLLVRPKPAFVIATGTAGTGKTLLSTSVGVHKLRNGEVERLIITRPMVLADEDIGFLPGAMDEKFMPWVRPVYDALRKCYSVAEIDRLVRSQTIELSPISFMRGRSFENCFIICDEAQNCTSRQIVLLLTRIGVGSKMVITGDPSQHDRPSTSTDYDCGLSDLIHRVHTKSTSHEFGVVELGEADVQRHPVVKDVVAMYN